MENKKEFLERLACEATLEQHPIGLDMDGDYEDAVERAADRLRKAMDNDEYEAWKENYLNEEYAKVKNIPWVTISYLFAGIGQYSSTVPEEQKGIIMNMINNSGSAFFGREEEATEDEIKLAIGMHAANVSELVDEEEKPENLPTIVSMRWGYDGGGMACGPVEGSTITEIMFLNEEGKTYFASVSRMSEFYNIGISEVPLFDVLLHMCDGKVDTEAEIEKVKKYSIIYEETSLGGYDFIEESKYAKEMKMVLSANDYYYNRSEDLDPNEWLDGVRNGDIAIEYPKMGWDDEEDDEDDDEE